MSYLKRKKESEKKKNLRVKSNPYKRSYNYNDVVNLSLG